MAVTTAIKRMNNTVCEFTQDEVITQLFQRVQNQALKNNL